MGVSSCHADDIRHRYFSAVAVGGYWLPLCNIDTVHVAPERFKAEKYLIALWKYGDRIPTERIEFIKTKLLDALKEAGIDATRSDIASKETLENYLEFFQSNDEVADKRHGQKVVEQCTDLTEFSRLWVKHFIDSMQPKYLPQYVNDLCTVS